MAGRRFFAQFEINNVKFIVCAPQNRGRLAPKTYHTFSTLVLQSVSNREFESSDTDWASFYSGFIPALPLQWTSDSTDPDQHYSDETVTHLFSCSAHPIDLAPRDMRAAPLLAQFLAGLPQLSPSTTIADQL